MKIRKLLLTLCIGLTVVVLTTTSFTYAWLSGATTMVNIEDLQGGVISQYFHTGDGSDENPFVITRPVHLYNLTQLYDKLDGFAEENYHFQLGYDLDNSGQLKCFNYTDSGAIGSGYSTALNMKSYSVLDPIGDEEKPFGGIFDGSGLSIENVSISGNGKSDIGFFGYVTEDAEIKDLYVDNLNIDVSGAVPDNHDKHNTNAYVGYLAGHVEDARCITNTYVNNCEISGSSCYTKNDWGYFGYCENAASLEEFILKAQGENVGWGGSVNMQKMYDRLYAIAGQATTVSGYAFEKDLVTKYDGSGIFERDAKTGTVYTYRDREEGSFVFGRYSNNAGPLSDYMYLNGGTLYHQYRQTAGTKSGYYISYNGHYLGVSNGVVADHMNAWELSNNKLSILLDGVTYYLNHNFELVTSTNDTWTKDGNRLSYSTGVWIFGTIHYMVYSNNRWTTQTSQVNLTFTTTTITYISGETTTGSDYMDYTGTNVTYFPLITNPDSYEVARKNTGYVIGGSEDHPAAYPDKTGDIRVSKYSTSDINKSYSNGNLDTVYTISAGLQTQQINVTDYEKYLESKTEFLDMIVNNNIYGLHFMSANINENHLVTADYTLINGEEKTNYQMPASSIDFNIMEKGLINFFAGTYFSGNNSFFSLHNIIRDSDDKITAIKEISEIYKSTDAKKDYIYKYSDNTYTASLTSDYSLVFSTARIKKQDSVTTNAVYYFEIPVNAGEYALGSVDGGTGAYLMYLDIATNAGVDYEGNLDTFGSIEYRSSPVVAENSILLLTYEQQPSENLNIKVIYDDTRKRYDIISNLVVNIKVTILNAEDYDYYVNNEQVTDTIGTHTF